MQPSADGSTLEPYTGAPLTVGGELDKLASNIALGRDFAGVHYRYDGEDGILIGEQVAIRVLQELKGSYNQGNISFTFTKRNGEKITI